LIALTEKERNNTQEFLKGLATHDQFHWTMKALEYWTISKHRIQSQNHWLNEKKMIFNHWIEAVEWKYENPWFKFNNKKELWPVVKCWCKIWEEKQWKGPKERS
jgi:hypothetical protein